MYTTSKPYVVHDYIRFSVLSDTGVKGLVIRSSNGVSHTMDCVDLLLDDSLCTPNSHVGYDRGVVYWWPQLITLQYTWPEDTRSLISQKHAAQMPNHDSEVLYDETSGRIVIYGYESHVKCIDLARM